MNLEWEVAHQIQSPAGNLDLNVIDPITGRCYLIQPENYLIAPTLRVTQDNRSQMDGSVLHPRYKTGVLATLTVLYALFPRGPGTADYTPACAQDLQEMDDALMEVLDSMRVLTTSSQRLLWTPTGFGDSKMLTDVQVNDWPVPSRDGTDTSQSWVFETSFPYAVTATQDTTHIANGASSPIPNDGTTATYPVFRVNGPFTNFLLTNSATGEVISYVGTRPGASGVAGGHYAEVNTFNGTVFLDGNSTDLIGAIDPSVTDFFTIAAGGNTVGLTLAGSGTVDVLSNDAWA